MFQKVTPKAGVLTRATIEAELERQSQTYLSILKSIGSKDEFKTRTEDKITELEALLEKSREEKENDEYSFSLDFESCLNLQS